MLVFSCRSLVSSFKFFTVICLIHFSHHALAQSALGLPSGFNAFVKEDFTAVATDIHGKLAAGGDIHLTSYGVATQIDTPADEATLIAGGDIYYHDGQVFTGSIAAGGDISQVGSEVINGLELGATASGSASFLPDIESEFSKLSLVSMFLSQAPANGTVEYKWGGVYMEGDCTSDTQVFDLDGDIVKQSYSFNLECVPDDATLIFNLSGINPGFVSIGLTHLSARASKIIYNFYQAEVVNFTYVGIEGTVLAPDAHFDNPRGHMNGSLYAKSWSGPMELHHVPFTGSLLVIANHPPEIVSEPEHVAYEQALYQYDVDAIDEDISIGDILSYSVDSAPSGLTIEQDTGLISWLPSNLFVASVEEFNSQCYVVPTGAVGVLQEGSSALPTYIAPLFQDVKQALEDASDFTAPKAYDWNEREGCFGCHVQTQTLVGLETSLAKADVDDAVAEYLLQEFIDNQLADGSIRKSHPTHAKTQTSLALWALENHPDRIRTASTRANALRFFQATQQGVSTNLFWTNDHETAWIRIPAAINALLAQATVGLLEDVDAGEVPFNAADLALAETYRSEIDAISRHLFLGAEGNVLDVAFKLMGLSELVQYIGNVQLQTDVRSKILEMDALLRASQLESGGWSLAFNSTTADPLITSWVGIALDYGNPALTDPVVLNTIKYLLDAQEANGVWRTSTGWFTTDFGTTSLVMAYLPIALDHLGNPDLRVGEFTLNQDENGNGTLSVRVHNRGITDAKSSSSLEVYAGEDANSPLLGTVGIPPLNSGEEEIITIPVPLESLHHAVYAQVVGAEALDECEIQNNVNRAAIVKARATDIRGLFDTQTYLINILDANEAPTFDIDGEITLEGGQSLRQKISASDGDVGDALKYVLDGAPVGLYIDENTGQLISDPSSLISGNYTFNVVVTDLRGATASQEVSLTVNENLPPEIVSIPVQQGVEGQGYSYDVDAVDPNGDTLGFAFNKVFSLGLNVGQSSGLITDHDDLFVESLSSTNDFCEALPATEGSLVFEEKWSWLHTHSNNGGVFGPVAVAQLNDDNGDGVIDVVDNPDVVFLSRNSVSTGESGKLYAVSGVDGQELWVKDDIAFSGLGSPSLADIDLDGVVEILLIDINRQTLIAVEHTGETKWAVPLGGPTKTGPRDSVSIADMDHDGIPEIIHGRSIFNSNGILLAEGSFEYGGETDYGIVSIVADIDLTGDMEIVAGRVAYDINGDVVWRNTSLPIEGSNAIGDFDDDDFPEIVFVGDGKVYLLDHQGQVVWGPVNIPGGGFGGTPTIADLDGDGEPEIGVAGAAFYVAFDTDGSELWKTATVDVSSNRTGSSVFDFQGDGAVEVVYADEINLYVYDGLTGEKLVEIPNESGTTLEYPVIVDIDNDGQAEVIVGSNDHSSQSVQSEFGLRVFESGGSNWAPTRAIWNQHSYHVTNINDDGSVPQNEQPSWLTHNTYRLNTFLDRNALSQADLALFNLAYNEEQQTLTATLKNRGLAPLAQSANVRFITNGDRVDDILLGEVSVDALNTEAEVQIVLADISADLLASFVYASVTTAASECNTANNIQGATVIEVGVFDEAGLSDTQTLLYSTVNINDAPFFVSAATSAIDTLQSYSFLAEVGDDDLGDAHHYSLQDAPEGVEINSITGEVSAVAGALDIGVYSFTILAEDIAGETADQLHILSVSQPDNLPPVFTSTFPTSAEVFEELSYTAIASDPDGDEVVYLLAENPRGMVIDGVTGQIFWTPSSAQVGINIVDITALDTNGASSSQRLSIEVADPNANNNAPQITSIPTGAVNAGEVFRYALVAVDPDGDTLTYSISGVEGDMTLTDGGVFTWLPSSSMIGNIYTVSLTVSDGRGGEATQTLALPVNESFNSPPVITSSPSQSAFEGEEYQYQLSAEDADGDSFSFSFGGEKPNGMVMSGAGLISWIPSSDQTNTVHNVEVRVIDDRGAISSQSYGIAVNVILEPNEPPYFISVPTSPAVIGEQYRYQAQAVDPDGNALMYTLVEPSLAGVTLVDGLFTWTPVAGQEGNYIVAIKVNDAQSSVTQSYTLTVDAERDLTNDYPVINSTPLSTTAVDAEYSYQVVATDPDGDNLTYELLNPSDPLDANISFDSGGLLLWTPAAGELGIKEFQVKVSDGQLASVQSWSVQVWDQYPPLQVFVDVSPSAVNEGELVQISVSTTGGSEPASTILYLDGVELPLDSLGRANTVAQGIGIHTVEVEAISGEEQLTSSQDFLVLDGSDTVAPTAEITSPAYDSVITAPTPILGTASDDNFAFYEVYVAPKNKIHSQTQWALIAKGTTAVVDDELAIFDPTLMVNGQYSIVLQVTDNNGQVSSASTSVVVEGDLKVGNFSFTVEDLVIPMAGIPIQVSRTYDSRRRNEALDFGYGWTVDYQNAKVEESREPGIGWALNQYRRGPFNLILDLCVEPLGSPVVSVTLPTGDVERFEVEASPRCSTYAATKDVELVFNAVGDTQSTLVALNDRFGYFIGNQIVETGTYSAPLNPNRYKLTTKSGYEYFLNQDYGIDKVIDPNGYTLTYTDDGIFHSNGKAVRFERYSDGRIREVVAPNGTRLEYEYDLMNDLQFVFDRDNAKTEYTYNNSHGLLDIIDPLGRQVLKNIYDDNGRLVGQEDGQGNLKTFDHDLDDNSSIVTDRDGRTTVFNYDDEGNVNEEVMVIADGSYDQDIVTSYSYDANNNQETRTIGESTWTASFNERNDQLFAEDPEGRIVYYHNYTKRGQEGEIEDEMGRVSELTYDSAGNLYRVTSAEVENPETGELEVPEAGNSINAKAQLTSTTDTTGFTTSYTYYPEGHAWEGQKETESNAITGTVTFTYDDSNNVKTETRQRSVDGAVTEETVMYDYDNRDRLTVTTYPDGSYTQTDYDLAGNTDKERDRMGNWTDYTYDVYGRLTHTLYADGSEESNQYTAEGLLELITDRSGNITRNEYDDAGRLWKVHNEQDSTFTETKYTLQGWVQYEWDANRNLTEYVYDKSGRRTDTIRIDTDGTELIWHTDYYPNGELHKETDPLLQTTEYIINTLDQRVETRYHNGTATKESFDFMGRKLSSTDQNERVTRFDVDNVGRLKGVTPEVDINGESVPVTSYEYDEVGNRITQTDANGHETLWTYDYFGRVLTRTLPEGQVESFVYDDALYQVTHTDFNGDTITTQMDTMGRVDTITYSKDGRSESYTYWPSGQSKTVTTTTNSGTELTEYFYDSNDRLEYELRANAVRMDYDYDAVGNRILVKVTRNGTVTSQTSYTYDGLNRLETVTDDLNPSDVTAYTYDPVGNMDTVTYANGMVSDYDYNTINQLTDVTTMDSSGNVVGHYHYGLSNTGRREVITELSGRTTANCYDALYRLKDEVIFDNAPATPLSEGCVSDTTNADYVANYEYDWVGNRTYETVNGVQTAYEYDDNDRLVETGGKVYDYDNNGNTLAETLDGDVTTYSYDGRNKMTSVDKDLGGVITTTGYSYNHNGIRSSKTEAATTTNYIVDENRDYAQVLEEVVGAVTEVSYRYGHDLISQNRSGSASASYYHYDGLGSTRALSDASGSLTDTYDYEAFGEVLNETGTTENAYKFTGEQYDNSLNQYYLRARYYDQGVGRFTQMDTYQGNNQDPITLHKYIYGNADPVTYTDPSGYMSMGSLSAGMSGMGTLSTLSIGRVGVVGFAANDAAFITGSITATQVGFATLRAMGATALTSLLVKKDSHDENSEKKISLSRVVDDTELGSMYACLCFSLGPNRFPKQFFHTGSEAVAFGYKSNFGLYKDPRFHLVQASISFWLYEILNHEANEPGIGSIITVQNELLSVFNIDMNKRGGFRYKAMFENNLP